MCSLLIIDMNEPEIPADFTPEEAAEYREMLAECPPGVVPNPEYIRCARPPVVGTFVNGLPIYDRSKRVDPKFKSTQGNSIQQDV